MAVSAMNGVQTAPTANDLTTRLRNKKTSTRSNLNKYCHDIQI